MPKDNTPIPTFTTEEEARANAPAQDGDAKNKRFLYRTTQEGKEPLFLWAANAVKARAVAAKTYGVDAELVDPARKPKEPLSKQLLKMSDEERRNVAKILAELGVDLGNAPAVSETAKELQTIAPSDVGQVPSGLFEEQAPVGPASVHEGKKGRRGNK